MTTEKTVVLYEQSRERDQRKVAKEQKQKQVSTAEKKT